MIGRILILVCLLTVSFFSSLAQVSVHAEPMVVKGVNSPYYEHHPVMNMAGDKLYFMRSNHPENVGGAKDEGDVWVATKDSAGSWSVPINLGSAINNEFKNSIIGLIGDDQFMLIAEQYGINNINSPTGISISEFKRGKWQQPVNIRLPYFKKRSRHINASVSADGNYMVFSIQSIGSYGVEDLYVSKRLNDGTWGELINLSTNVNTPFQELSGFLTPDNKFLVFSSNGHGGFGSFDLFVSERLDDSWRNWSSPQNLGSLINTEGAEHYFTYLPGAEFAYFTSTQNSDGYGDIKRIKITKDSTVIDKPDTVLTEIPGFVKVTGELIDAKSAAGLSSEVLINVETTESSITTNADAAGKFEFLVPEGSFISVFVDKIKYLPYEESFNITDLSKDSTLTIQLEPLTIGNTITLKHVLFERASNKFLTGSEKELDLLVRMMNENPTINIFLSGHTDNTGNPKANAQLSQDRVDAVKAYLVENGIKSGRISGKGFGGTKPVASNESEETRKLNRRVEFEVVK